MKERDKRPQQLTLEEVVRAAKEVALRDGGHAPMVIADGSLNSVVGQISDFPGTHEGRIRRMLALGFALGDSGEVGYLKQVFFISEGWMSTSQESKLPEMQPSQDPNRTEVLLIDHLVLKEKRTKSVIFEMVRSPEGRLIALRDVQEHWDDKAGHMESPLLNAFVKGFSLGIRAKVN